MSAALVTTEIASPVGPLLVGANDEGVCMLEFSDCDRASQTAAANGVAKNGAHLFLEQLRGELADYFAGRLTEFRVPLSIDGTEWQRKVWGELRRIPHGQTRSYQDVARAVCSAKAARAVGMANGQNRIAIVIPCHRVINAGGKLGGYGGGLWRKEFLLALERGQEPPA
ncbi:MAG TPA: methylated-DNA--[protein]-cysteine S-methyltransferase [Gemmataceae bacterium]|nr:methylated-DNA--[protein]-cysteine S-methyltransferase [Gemmataceae bacterium]